MTDTLHIGQKISRIRELRGMKQEALAQELGISQQAISKLEQSEKIEEEVLDKIAKALGVTAEGLKKFNEETILNIISNTFTSNDTSTINAINIQPTFNPIDKLIEVYEENKKLYEKLLASEREKIEILKNK
ncbi:helix-turn-helix domain-containing protein [Pedobacter glucosidilyticus]|uniref:helix-turn-helix domain-containing protein n=1 Tax=Pedobacter glucosidilyticus TaxID=1122941 RepID=UPI000411BA6B|nr:helix-turn-helix domain-containing protein [Pedobacter glucosidilyticus]